MKQLYWVAWILAALAVWLTVGWFGLKFAVVDPYFDRQVDAVAAKAPSVFLSKEDVAEIERARSSAFNALGVFGGVLCGFAFGVAGCRFSSTRRNKSEGLATVKQDE
ncbi:hypothetical protein [Roseateles amylovorans]|uniref:Cobalt transporter n=1 Tax=Roseateles amylovorans TaxID=2978473 RepID=A0ABY6B4G1_9BURK|nr:hypothetical protein [Roseateles amylovorans]UXH78155.1 hypothetical protein N4261_24920 [Roseateles amylovorans]